MSLLGKMRRRDDLHHLDAAELPERGLDASSVADIGKKKSKAKDKEERKRNRKRVQSPTSTVGDWTVSWTGRSAYKSPWYVGNKI